MTIGSAGRCDSVRNRPTILTEPMRRTLILALLVALAFAAIAAHSQRRFLSAYAPPTSDKRKSASL